jgi:hypothetical protein
MARRVGARKRFSHGATPVIASACRLGLRLTADDIGLGRRLLFVLPVTLRHLSPGLLTLDRDLPRLRRGLVDGNRDLEHAVLERSVGLVERRAVRQRDLAPDATFEALVPDAILVALMSLLARGCLDDQTARLTFDGDLIGSEPGQRHLDAQAVLILMHIDRRYQRRL